MREPPNPPRARDGRTESPSQAAHYSCRPLSPRRVKNRLSMSREAATQTSSCKINQSRAISRTRRRIAWATSYRHHSSRSMKMLCVTNGGKSSSATCSWTIPMSSQTYSRSRTERSNWTDKKPDQSQERSTKRKKPRRRPILKQIQ